MSVPPLAAFYRLTRLERIDSTNDHAKREAEAGAPAGTLIVAREQSAGRGRRGRDWVSPAGNLYCSLVLRPTVAAAGAAQLGFAAALAVAEACEASLPPGAEVRCKWPNDVLVGGGKVAGILLESRAAPDGALAWLVVGIGVNLVASPAAAEFPATSLAAAGGGAVLPDAMLALVAARFLHWYEAWRGPDGFARVRAAWLARAHGLGAELRVRLPAAELHGRFAGLDESGMLLLDGAAGRRRIAAADVFPAD